MIIHPAEDVSEALMGPAECLVADLVVRTAGRAATGNQP